MSNRPKVSRRDTLLRIGASGDLARRRLSPALAQLFQENKVRRVIDVDTRAQGVTRDPLLDRVHIEHAYHQVGEDSLLPDAVRSTLAELGPNAVAYIACPTARHLYYTEQLSDYDCRTAVEKPLTRDLAGAQALPHKNDVKLYPVGHQLFKATMRRALDDFRRDELLRAEGFEFNLLETEGVGERAIDGAVWDTGWHGFEVIMAPFRVLSIDVEFSVCEAKTATYDPTPDQPVPDEHTAARIDGYLDYGRGPIPFVIRVGKGLGVTLKELAIWNRHGHVQRLISLRESGWEAHYHVLNELICAETPDMRLSLADAVQIVRACSDADERAVDLGVYPVGQLPAFLKGGHTATVLSA